MDKLLIVLGFSAGDAMQAERLLDYIAILNGKVPRNHCLLVAAPDTHQESQVKLRIAAEVAFESVELLAVPWPAVAHTSKVEAVNFLFYTAMTHAARCYQWPALWLEPDCVPLKSSWVVELQEAYAHQPKRYLGSILSTPDGKTRSLSRVAIYPRGAGGELKELCAGKTPFELAAGALIVPRAGKTKLITQMRFTDKCNRASIREGAVLLHGDKEAVLLSQLIDEASKPVNLEPQGVITDEMMTRFVPANDETVGAYSKPNPDWTDAEPLDKRTRAWKDWNAKKTALANAQT